MLKVGNAFFSRVCHAVVFTQLGYADSKSPPCQALFWLFPTQKFKNKMATEICENFTTIHHGLAHNEHKKSFLLKITFLGSGNSVMMFLKVI